MGTPHNYRYVVHDRWPGDADWDEKHPVWFETKDQAYDYFCRQPTRRGSFRITDTLTGEVETHMADRRFKPRDREIIRG